MTFSRTATRDCLRCGWEMWRSYRVVCTLSPVAPALVVWIVQTQTSVNNFHASLQHSGCRRSGWHLGCARNECHDFQMDACAKSSGIRGDIWFCFVCDSQNNSPLSSCMVESRRPGLVCRKATNLNSTKLSWSSTCAEIPHWVTL